LFACSASSTWRKWTVPATAAATAAYRGDGKHAVLRQEYHHPQDGVDLLGWIYQLGHCQTLLPVCG